MGELSQQLEHKYSDFILHLLHISASGIYLFCFFSNFTSLLILSCKMTVLNTVTIKHFLLTHMETVHLQSLNFGSKYDNLKHIIMFIKLSFN